MTRQSMIRVVFGYNRKDWWISWTYE